MTDKGPWQAEESRANAIAAWLRSTGLYESVVVEGVDSQPSDDWAPPDGAEPAPASIAVSLPGDPEPVPESAAA